jgi:hypothetical protein
MGKAVKELKDAAEAMQRIYKGKSRQVLYSSLLLITAAILTPAWGAAEDRQGQALVSAAMAGRVEQVKELLAQGVDVNSKNPAGRSALHLAAFNGNDLTVLALVSAGADVNLADAKGATALMDAAAFGHHVVVDILIQAGVDVNARDQAGKTALDYANQGGFNAIIKKLTDTAAVK